MENLKQLKIVKSPSWINWRQPYDADKSLV